ncbi:MAG: GNAT family N-acetyltransferase [Erysipelotrichaceae bacterium]|nr:GNAT family N-acetyltransferase [Erysipelotrichaceae bacterium]
MKDWWKKEIVYQIYPRSFYDSNNDGIGDIQGIIQKLDYLSDLGITMLWICPIYKSPMDDNGYDISDYYDINPEFGTMNDVDELISEAKKRNMKIIMDLVINHTSEEHEWFKEAMNNPHSPKHDYYIFKQGKERPNNWRSVFGGSVWEKVKDRDEYYFHSFSKKQPDLNWENEELRKELYKMINWWLDKGIAGFRVDAINFIKKDQSYQNGIVDGQDGLSACFPYTRNQSGIEVFFKELREETFEKHNCMSVAETVGVKYSDLGIFIGEDGCFSMMFDFNYCNFDINEDEEWFRRQDWTVKDFRELLFTSQQEVQKLGWIASFLENHDQPRAIDKFIPKENHHYHSNTMLAGMFFNLRGTPFIYQGEEIGMENFVRDSLDDFDDISSHNQYHRAIEEGFSHAEAMKFLNQRSRDNSRVPMQWDDSKYGGFSQHEPWLKMCGNQSTINVENQIHDSHSIYSFYKEMINIRKKENTLVYGDFKAIENINDNVIAYQRIYKDQIIICLCNFADEVMKIPYISGTIFLNNYDTYTLKQLQPYQFVMLKGIKTHDYFMNSSRLGFSLWSDNDIELMISLYGQRDVSQFISANGVFTNNQIEHRLNNEINNYKQYHIQYYPLFSLIDHSFVGCCGLRPTNELNVYEIGFHIKKECRHQGFAAEAAKQVIHYAFTSLNATKIIAGHHPDNMASKALISNLGFKYIQDSYYEPTGLMHPTYAIRKDDSHA